MDYVLNHWQLIAVVAGAIVLLVCYRWVLALCGVIIVPDDSVGVMTKKFVIFGKNRRLPAGMIIARNGEAGYQADTLPPGLHVGLWPWQYQVDLVKFYTVPPGKFGCVEACDGKPLPSGRIVAQLVACDSFQDARAFLENGGQRGPQMGLIPPGTYRINSLLFSITLTDAIVVPSGQVGINEARDGIPLGGGRVIARHIECDSFQDASAFIAGGGERGPQGALIAPGTYRINPLGVWVEPLDPGKYPINPYTHKVTNVPTANVVLNWATGKTEAHQLDANLSTITVRSADGFKFNLDVSQIIHIPRNDAPKVIARFGSMSALSPLPISTRRQTSSRRKDRRAQRRSMPKRTRR